MVANPLSDTDLAHAVAVASEYGRSPLSAEVRLLAATEGNERVAEILTLIHRLREGDPAWTERARRHGFPDLPEHLRTESAFHA